MLNITQTVDSLMEQHNKSELIALARALGWKGDPERAYSSMIDGRYIAQIDQAAIDVHRNAGQLATGKAALAYFIAGRQTGSTVQQPEPQQPIEPMPQQMQQTQPTVEPVARITPPPVHSNDQAAKIAQLIEALTPPAQALNMDEIRDYINNSVMDYTASAVIASEARTDEKLSKTIDTMAEATLSIVDKAKKELLQIAQGNAQPKEIIITTPTNTAKISGILHPQFEKVLRLVNSGLNVLLVGGAGSGKTQLCEQIAQALQVKFGVLNGSSGASESQLTGWLLPTGANGKFEYNPAPFVELYEGGNSLFCFDEFDAFDPNMLLIANSALSNGYINIPQRIGNNRVNKGERQYIIANANTFGTGADMIYSGRNQLDGATLDRFYLVHIDYNATLEASILGQSAKAAPAFKAATDDPQAIEKDLAELFTWLNDLRAKVSTSRLRRVISTRAFQKADKARRALIPADQIKKDLVQGWTADELKKVGLEA